VRRVLTVGHSTHDAEAFGALVQGAGIELIADVRAYPRSRRHPHFDRDAIEEWLPVAYRHLPALGGRRSPSPDSPNAGWENAAFRAYADHMATAEFAAGLAELEAQADERTAAVMCAEGLWWRCHRRLVADALTARGWAVDHVAPDGRLTRHELPAFAHVGEDGAVTYPAPQLSLDDLGAQRP